MVDGRPTTYQPPKILSCCGGFHVIFFIHIRCFLCYDHKMLYKLKYKSRKFKYPVTYILLLKTAEILCISIIWRFLSKKGSSMKTYLKPEDIPEILYGSSSKKVNSLPGRANFQFAYGRHKWTSFLVIVLHWNVTCIVLFSFEIWEADAVVSKKIRSS